MLLCFAAFGVETATKVKVSSYAPVEDLVAAQKFFLAQLEEQLASKEEYAEDTQERVKKNALVLAVLSMHLGLHDVKNAAQQSGHMMSLSSEALARSANKYDDAKRSYNLILKSQKEHIWVASGEEFVWKKISGQGAMMKKVNEINSAIKRNLTAARFAKQLDALKIQTVTLAAIGQATLLDTHEVKNPADFPTYEKYAVEFRTAAAELNKSVHAADQAAALKAFARMDASCHTCHQKFDPPQK